MLARESVADMVREILTFGAGCQEVAIQLRWKIEVAIEFACAKAQVEQALIGQICG